ncbi:MAG: hypothetical protein NVSMB46_01680 [Candidatus Saccharimonadales bacterium]
MLNGGRDERAILKSSESLAVYKNLGIKNVLFIVYALNESYWQMLWQSSGSLISIPGMNCQSLTMYEKNLSVIKEKLQWADFIYFPGGSQTVLLDRLQSIGTDKELFQIMKHGRLKLLGGGSAGAMVMGSWCIVGRTVVTKVLPGLNILPNCVIDSHFSERQRLDRLRNVIKDIPHTKGYGIDEDTAVLFDNTFKIKAVYGAGTVNVCDNDVITYDKNSTFSV